MGKKSKDASANVDQTTEYSYDKLIRSTTIRVQSKAESPTLLEKESSSGEDLIAYFEMLYEQEMSKALLTTTDRKLLAKTKKMIEEVLETREILADEELMQSIKSSKNDLGAGRTVPWEQLKRELRSKKKL